MVKIVMKSMEWKEGVALFFKIMKLVSPVSGVGMISTICIFLSVVYYFFVIPYQWHTLPIPFLIVNIAISHWILINTIYNYVLAILIHPGRSKGKGISKCRTCRTNRPERSHHCRQCGFCVLMMDHHCMWINNCVGYYNYGYFMRSCIYVLIGAGYGTLALWPEVSAYSSGTSVMFNVEDFPNICFIAWVICFGMFVAFFILNIWYFSLIKSGMTSVEYKQMQGWKGTVSPYDRGLKTNLAYALGVKNGRWSKLLWPCYFVPFNYWTEVDLEDVGTEI